MLSDNNSTDPGVWKRIEEDIPRQREEVPVLDIWKLAEERLNPAKYRPARIADAEIEALGVLDSPQPPDPSPDCK